jgi:hypothetical protein
MFQRLLITTALAAVPLVCWTSAKAQDISEAPKPAMGGDSVVAGLQSTSAEVPDTRPLAGAQDLSLGGQKSSHSFLLPSFGVTTALQFNGSDAAGTPSPATTTYISGRLGVNKISSRSELLVDYLAGGGFSNYGNQNSQVIQSLDFSETIRGGRWSQMFGEQFTYLPASSFNFGGLGGLNRLGVSLSGVGSTPGFRQDLLPDQSIVTNSGARISNAAFAQTSYLLSYRSSLSAFGTYGTLHFIDGGLQNSNTIGAGVGYNYLLSPLNSMSISYGFTKLMFSGLAERAVGHSAIVSFARRITARLSAQVGAGPQVQLFTAPLAGSGTVVSWTLNSALNYQLANWGLGFGYSHSLTGGSGVLNGAETDLFSGHASRKLGNWQTSTGIGYSRNHALQQTAWSTFTSQSWFAGASLSRQFVSFGSFSIAYNVSRQSNLSVVCPVAACGTTGLMQTVSLSYNWGFRPIVLE